MLFSKLINQFPKYNPGENKDPGAHGCLIQKSLFLECVGIGIFLIVIL